MGAGWISRIELAPAHGDKVKKINLIMFIVLLSLANFGCAHYHKIVGNEEKSEIPEGVRVKIGSPEVKEGDSVDIFKKVCPKMKTNPKYEQDDHSCESQKVGSSKVLKILTKDTAIISAPTFSIDKTMTVEKSETN